MSGDSDFLDWLEGKKFKTWAKALKFIRKHEGFRQESFRKVFGDFFNMVVTENNETISLIKTGQVVVRNVKGEFISGKGFEVQIKEVKEKNGR